MIAKGDGRRPTGEGRRANEDGLTKKGLGCAFDVPPEAFMAIELEPQARGIRGIVRSRPELDAASRAPGAQRAAGFAAFGAPGANRAPK